MVAKFILPGANDGGGPKRTIYCRFFFWDQDKYSTLYCAFLTSLLLMALGTRLIGNFRARVVCDKMFVVILGDEVDIGNFRARVVCDKTFVVILGDEVDR